MRKNFISSVSSVLVGIAGATTLAACGQPPVASGTALRLKLLAAPGHEASIAAAPRVALLTAKSYLSGDGRVYEAELREFDVDARSATDLRIDLAAALGKDDDVVRTAGALVLLAPDAPRERVLITDDEEFGEAPVLSTGALVPRLTASQAETLGVLAVLPLYVLLADGTETDDNDVFVDARACTDDQADLVYPATAGCQPVALAEGFHIGRLDPVREDYTAVFDWRICAGDVRHEKSTHVGDLGFAPPAEELAAAQVEECGEHPGNHGRVARLKQGDEVAFEVGGADDLLAGLANAG
jgi:hypothetical protein